MERNVIGFTVPTSISWWRMKQILFNPFDLGKWFVLGMSAWLATLMEGGGSSGSGGGGGEYSEDLDGEIRESVNEGISWVQNNLEIVITVTAIVTVFVVIVLVTLFWLQSRGKFMFLDNVVHNRALVGQPWKEFRAEGNSLFLWMLAYSLIAFLVFGSVIGGGGLALYTQLSAQEMEWTGAAIGTAIGLIVLVVILGLLCSYISMLLENFVIPLMYQRRVGAVEAWRAFLGLHSQYAGKFVLFFLWSALLGFVWSFALLAVVLLTCCIAGIIMAIPYLGAVLVLPLTVFFRTLGPTFIQQFGEEFDLWKGSELEVQT